MKKTLSLLFLVPILMILLAACGNTNDSSDNNTKSQSKDKLTINTTVYPLQSFIEQIGGDHVKVSSIYPAGTDLHNYEPTQKDILDAGKGDLFVYTGDSLDPVAKKVASAIKDDDRTLSLENKINKSELLADHHDHEEGEEHEEHEHGTYDPHVWLDPKLDQTFAKEIKDELVKKDPDHKADYEKNYQKLNNDLKDIDKQLQDATKDKKDHVAFISHESIGYLAKRYGFEQRGIQNMNAEDPSQKELTSIVKEIKDSKAKYILYEDNVSNKVTETIRHETDAQPLKFYNMESLNKDQQNQDDISYQSLMKTNINNLSKALDSDVKAKDDKH